MDEHSTSLVRDDKDFAPWNVEIEQTLIGWALRDERAIPFIQDRAKASDFYEALHQRIFERIFAKYEMNSPVTAMTLRASMKNDAALLSFDFDYLGRCVDYAPAFGSIEELQRQVRNAAREIAGLKVRRDAEESLIKAVASMRAGESIDNSLQPVIEVAETETARNEQDSGSISVKDAGYAFTRELDSEDPDAHLARSSVGILRLDELMGGMVDSNLLVVGGRPGMGKSIFGTTAAIASAREGFDVDYFSLEMTARELVARMLCDLDYDAAMRNGLMPIHYSRALMNRLTPEEKYRLHEAMQILSGLPIEIHDRDELSMYQIQAIARARQASRRGVKRRVIIDHMHLIEPSERYRGRKVDEISEVTRGCKRMAKRLGIGVCLLAQLNRDIERRDTKMPTMADFRDAGSIEQDADTMIGINRPHYWLQKERGKDELSESKRQTELIQKAHVVELGIIKNRHGPTAEISIYGDVACSAFRDSEPTRQGSLLDLNRTTENLF